MLVWLSLSCLMHLYFFFFKQKTAYEMRISDWSSDVCSSDLETDEHHAVGKGASHVMQYQRGAELAVHVAAPHHGSDRAIADLVDFFGRIAGRAPVKDADNDAGNALLFRIAAFNEIFHEVLVR